MQASIEERIAKVQSVLQSAVIVSDYHGDTVNLGSAVTIQKKGDTNKRTFTIVGSEESDMKEGKLSHRSPIGEALIGKKKGEVVSVKVPAGLADYTILDIK